MTKKTKQKHEEPAIAKQLNYEKMSLDELVGLIDPKDKQNIVVILGSARDDT